MDQLNQILKDYWGYSAFRPMQEDIMRSAVEGRDTLALLPTGGGKSLCFQVPALAMEGVCLVISPLIALMKDQVENLRKRNIPAAMVSSGMSRHEIDVAFDNASFGKTKFLYISPERLASPLFLDRLAKMHICLLAVDEAHCISQWGYDFRPAYLKIAEIRKLLPKVPVLALTATATPEVRLDIINRLELRQPEVFVQSFFRKNLSYVVLYDEDKLKRMLKILDKVPGTGIVYTRNRRRTKELADYLVRNRIKADYYHAGLDHATRSKRQDNWKSGQTRVMVSTNAFGMGIDKPDVRSVIHFELVDSLEAYYQEAGRGGRDGKKAYAVQLYNESDLVELKENPGKNFPSVADVKRCYQALANYFSLAAGSGEGATFDFDFNKFCSTYKLQPLITFNALKELEKEGYISMSEAIYMPSRVMITTDQATLYDHEIRNKKDEPLIKALLRSGEGIFEDFCMIQETDLARRAGLGLNETVEKIKYLQKSGLLEYLPTKDSPQITYLKPRLDDKNLQVDRNGLELRKKRHEVRIAAVLKYVTSKTRCRSKMLLEYFGEDDSQRCGSCDFCLERNKLELSDLEFTSLKDMIKEKLSTGPARLENLLQAIGPREDKAIKVLRWLTDNGKVITEKNLYRWKD